MSCHRSQKLTTEQRFWCKVSRTENVSECWLWTGRTSNGYGIFLMPDNKQKKAHRVSYELLIGPIPHGRDLHHECGTVHGEGHSVWEAMLAARDRYYEGQK